MGATGRRIWTYFCAERRIKLLSQGVGAHPWILERRNGLARGSFNRLSENDRYSGRQILAEAQWRLNTMISASGYSASRFVFGSNPADLYGWGDQEEDLLFAQDASVPGQFAQQWKLRMLAREAASQKVATRKLRRLGAFSQTFNWTLCFFL